MNGVDANGATWVVLRTEVDFLPRPDPVHGTDPVGPALLAGAAYDPHRHVLELAVEPPLGPAEPLPGLAVDPDGVTYRVVDDAIQVDCAGAREELVTEPGLLRAPQGLALDTRGLLYVADRRGRQVLVIAPEDGQLEARLRADGMREPVDVAVAPDGSVYVADRGGGDLLGLDPGHIWRFDATFSPSGGWIPRDGATPARPRRPRPIAVMWRPGDGGGEVLVVDAGHSRVLSFGADGTSRGGVALERLLEGLPARPDDTRDGPPPVDASAYGPHGRRSAAAHARVHLALRLHRLELGARHQPCGAWLSAVLDSGSYGTRWHRVDLDVDLPPGTAVAVDSATAGTAEALADVRDGADAPTPGPGCPPLDPRPAGGTQPIWDELRWRDGSRLWLGGPEPAEPAPLRYDRAATAATIREQLVRSAPGRYLRLRVHLHGDGRVTPRLRGMKLVYPRRSYLDELPAVWRRDPEAERFLEGFLALFERVLTRLEDRRDTFYAQLRPASAPPDVLTWLAGLLDLSFDPSWPLERRRLLVSEAVDLYRMRGTPAGMVRYVQVYTGVTPVITEGFAERPGGPPVTGVSGVLGQTFAVGVGPVADATPGEELIRAFAHRFTVHLPLADDCDVDTTTAVIDRIVTINKPAHTEHRLAVTRPDARVDVHSTVGVDLVVSADLAMPTTLAEPGAPGSGSVLGHDTVLHPRRGRPRPPDPI